MPSLGRMLGAFGKTNVLDVSQNLWKQYGDIQNQRVQNQKDSLLMDLRMREDKRAQDEFNMKKAEYEKKTRMVKFDDVAEKVGSPRMAKRFKEQYTMMGLINEDGMVQTGDLQRWPDIAKAMESQADLVLDDRIADLNDEVFNLKEEEKTAKDPKVLADLRMKIARKTNERDNLTMTRPGVKEHVAKLKAEQGVKDPTGELQEAARKKAIADADKARADAVKALADAEDAKSGEGTGESKVVTPAAVKSISHAVNEVVILKMLPNTQKRLADNADEPFKAADTARIQEELKKDPTQYKFYQDVRTTAEKIYKRSRGLIDPQAAALAAYEDVLDRRTSGKKSFDEKVEGVFDQWDISEKGLKFYSKSGATGERTEHLYEPPSGMDPEEAKKITEAARDALIAGRSPMEVWMVLTNQFKFKRAK